MPYKETLELHLLMCTTTKMSVMQSWMELETVKTGAAALKRLGIGILTTGKDLSTAKSDFAACMESH